jgi:F-type H+-transporting ATPase subunit gamma
MPELRELQRKLDSVNALRDVVAAMRNLAAIYVRRAESALAAVRPYSEIVETCLDVMLAAAEIPDTPSDPDSHALALVFSGNQGLCGSYNERVVASAAAFKGGRSGRTDFIAIGRRGYELLRRDGVEPLMIAAAPTSLEGIKAQVPELAVDVYREYAECGAACLFFIYNGYAGMGRFEERVCQVIPPRRGQLAAEKRRFRCKPLLTDTPDALLGAFVEQYFFIELYRALFESHSSENGARLLAMTAAAGNIDEHSTELTQAFQSARQDVITAELLDVVGGAEALRQA